MGVFGQTQKPIAHSVQIPISPFSLVNGNSLGQAVARRTPSLVVTGWHWQVSQRSIIIHAFKIVSREVT